MFEYWQLGKLVSWGRLNAVAPSPLVHMEDQLSKRRFLVETGASFSIYPFSSKAAPTGSTLFGPAGKLSIYSISGFFSSGSAMPLWSSTARRLPTWRLPAPSQTQYGKGTPGLFGHHKLRFVPSAMKILRPLTDILRGSPGPTTALEW
jgi:hypothetical protein